MPLLDIKKPYKFRDLKVYSSVDWLYDNKKRYRQVFDVTEITHVYCELSLYNKYFDIEDYTLDITFKCFQVKKTMKEVCNMTFQRIVSKYDHVAFIREGWGSKTPGGFWKRGTYLWEIHIDGQKVGSKYFYMEDLMSPIFDFSPQISLEHLLLFESGFLDPNESNRTYLKAFNAAETRYVCVATKFTNFFPERNWFCEVFFKFFNSARELKGEVVKIIEVPKNAESFDVEAQWGSNIKGVWNKDVYTIEVVFMNKLVGFAKFEMEKQFEPGGVILLDPDFLPSQQQMPKLAEANENTDALAELKKMIGLQSLKQKIYDHAEYIQYLKLRREKGYVEQEELTFHSVFIGNPGTGKTTVANMMGRIYKQLGVLSKGHVHSVDRVQLVGEFIGQTAPKVREAIERARGGVLFIDEAYSLARAHDDNKDFGREVIEILIKEMSDGENDLVVIAAGYPKEMKYFLESNPGLKSRFKTVFEFSDYFPNELIEISKIALNKKGLNVKDPRVAEILDDLIVQAYRQRDRSFGNARFVFDLIEDAKLNLAKRVMSDENVLTQSLDQLSTLQVEDVAAIKQKQKFETLFLPIDFPLLEDARTEMNQLIGMANIKNELEELIRIVLFYRETNREVLNKFYLHTILIGNPGTGKTTIARIITKIYKALGIIERGHLVETDRQGLVAGYVGQTAQKTSERIDEAIGGVLFIDEAYALSENGKGQNDFGNEAIQTLLKRMEDQRGQFYVFVAGYPENMDNFMKTNPGLRSRFDKVLRFEDYDVNELFEIAAVMFQEEGLKLRPDAELHLRNYLQFIYDYRDKYFGNARTVRQIVTDAVKNYSLRLASMKPSDRTLEVLEHLELEDVKDFKMDKKALALHNKTGIGFQTLSQGGK